MAVFDKERFDNLYNSDLYEGNTHNWEDATASARAKAFYEALKSAHILEHVNSVLDVGCGSGGIIVELKKRYGHFIGGGRAKFQGIDPSPRAIEIAKKLYSEFESEGVRFSVALLAEDTRIERHSVVSLIHVLEHCPDMLEMLSLCERHGDFVYINVPVDVNLFYALRPKVLARQYMNYGHLHFFNEAFILEWLCQNGFKVLATSYSADFEINKKGVAFQVVKSLRRLAGKLLGPPVATWLLGGYSFGVLVRSRVS